MNKWQIICPVVALAIVGLVLIRQQAAGDRRYLQAAVERQIDEHSSQIASLLTTMSTNDTSAIEDAVYRELVERRVYSTSLIKRPDVRVSRASDGVQCVIDASQWGVAPRRIRQSGVAP